VVSRFNDFITSRLLDGALDALNRHSVKPEDVLVVKVPGTFEIPAAASLLAKGGKFDAVICLGAVIRGATTHYELVAAEAAKGIAQTALEHGVPVAFGVVTADNLEQAIERAGSKQGNKGAEAALCAIEAADLWPQIQS
jgi:6,7-dimethyl-8-ribityllumazine synthase